VSEDARVALVRELERADEAVAAVLAEVDELYAECEAVRERALAIEAFLTRLPAEREDAARTIEKAAGELEEAEAAAARAAVELREAEAARDAERLAAARRFAVRSRDSASAASRRAAEAHAAAAELEARAAAHEGEIPELEARARRLAAALSERPRFADAGTAPAPGLAGVAEWAAGARAARLVARTSLAAERDAVIRQANELGALVLGEPLAASGTAVVLRRLERELERG